MCFYKKLRRLLLHLKPELHVCSAPAAGGVNNACCSGFISQQLLLFLSSNSVPLIVSPHYEMYWRCLSVLLRRFPRAALISLISLGLILLNTVDGDQSQVLMREIQENKIQGGQASQTFCQGFQPSILYYFNNVKCVFVICVLIQISADTVIDHLIDVTRFSSKAENVEATSLKLY